jgi:hypothetical protein
VFSQQVLLPWQVVLVLPDVASRVAVVAMSSCVLLLSQVVLLLLQCQVACCCCGKFAVAWEVVLLPAVTSCDACGIARLSQVVLRLVLQVVLLCHK